MKTSVVTEVTKRWLSNSEAAKYLGVSLDTMRRLREQAKLHYYQLGDKDKGRKIIWYEVKDLDRLIQSLKVI